MVVKRGQTLGRRSRRRLLGVVSSRSVRVAPPGLKAGSPIACATRHPATEGSYDPEPILADLVSYG